MVNIVVRFADSSSSSGLGAFNINWKSFIFQLITFLLVLFIFKRWILPPISKTLMERRNTLEKSLTDAKRTEETLANAEAKADELLRGAREQADRAVVQAGAQAKEIVARAEAAADVRAQRIITETEERLNQERLKLREELKDELADLVVTTTEKVLRHKLNDYEDRKLVEAAVREIGQ